MSKTRVTYFDTKNEQSSMNTRMFLVVLVLGSMMLIAGNVNIVNAITKLWVAL